MQFKCILLSFLLMAATLTYAFDEHDPSAVVTVAPVVHEESVPHIRAKRWYGGYGGYGGPWGGYGSNYGYNSGWGLSSSLNVGGFSNGYGGGWGWGK